MLVVAAFIWIVFAIIVAVAANTRGRLAFAWFFISVLLSPLLAGLLLLAQPRFTAIALDCSNSKRFNDLINYQIPLIRTRGPIGAVQWT
jgi:NhaP-type Na+/H+ and K+/H+ antiporter